MPKKKDSKVSKPLIKTEGLKSKPRNLPIEIFFKKTKK